MTVATAAPPPAPAPPPGPEDRFVRPRFFWNLMIQPGVIGTTVLAASQPAYDAVAAKVPVPPRRALQVFAVGTWVLHVAEGVSAYRGAKRAGLDRSARRWAIETFVLGFPVLLSLKRHTGA